MTSQRVEVQAWDGSRYETVGFLTHFSPETKERSTDTFDPVVTTKLRFYQRPSEGPDSYDSVMWLTEVDYNVDFPVAVDSTYPGYSKDVINDGDINTLGGTDTTWASTESMTEPHWVELTLDRQQTLDSATIHWAYNHKRRQYMSPQQLEVQAWTDSGYSTVATINPKVDVEATTVEFEPVITSKLRFSQPAGMGPSAYPAVMWLSEIDVGTAPRIRVDSTYPGYDTAPIDDGVIDAFGGTRTTWASAESNESHAVTIDLGKEMRLGPVTIHWAWNHKREEYMTSQRVDVQIWNGSEFWDVQTIRPTGPEASTSFFFYPYPTRTLRFIQPPNHGPVNYDTVMWITEIDLEPLDEFEASFTTDPASGFEAGVAIGFTDTSTHPNGELTAWTWDFGDGNASVAQHPIHTYSEPGRYEVTLTASRGGQTTEHHRVLDVAGISVDSTYAGYSTSVIDDGVIDATGGTSTTWASSESSSAPHFVEVHLGGTKEVDYATIHWAFNDKRGEYMTSQEVQVQNWNGSSYATIATVKPTSAETETTITFDPVMTNRLRFYQPTGQGPSSYDRVMWLTEIDYGLSP